MQTLGGLLLAALLFGVLGSPSSAWAQSEETLITDYDGGGIVSDLVAFGGISAEDVGTELSVAGNEVGGSGQFPGVANILSSATDFTETPVVAVRMKVSASSEGPAIIRAALNEVGGSPGANSSADALITEVPADGEYRDYYFDFTDLFVQFDGAEVDPTNIGEVVFLVNDGGALGFLGQSGTFTGEIVIDRVARRADVPGGGGGGGGDDSGDPFLGDDNGDGILVFDTFEDYTVGDAISGSGQPYFAFSGNGASIDNITVSNDVPPEASSAIAQDNSTKALEATFSGGDGTGFLGFGRGVNSEVDPAGFDISGLGSDPYVTMYLQSSATEQYGLIVEIQEDTDGDGVFEGATEDNFRYTHTVDPSTSGYEFLSIRASQFTALNNSDDGTLDLQRVGNIVFLIAGDQAGLPAETFTLNVDELGFTDDGSPLPVELDGFDVQADGSDAVLTWQTLSETNNARFDVQVASGSSAFRTVGSVDGAGTTAEPQSYRFRVDNLDPGVHQFRLRQVDVDGTVTLSEVQRLSMGANAPFTMVRNVPNPIGPGQSATMEYSVRDREPVRVALYNVLGQRIRLLRDGVSTPGSVASVQLPTDELASGMYFVRITGSSFSRTVRVSVVR